MRIDREAVAGTLESSDVIVRVAPAGKDTEATLEVLVISNVMAQFGDAIREVVDDTLTRLGVESGRIVVEDKGALDCTIRARVQAACLRGSGAPEDVDWSRL
ncbi:citrate lyase subunit gamma (acyl carrier protein) [Austwickia chelonae]|uniref:Citrate lyase acyl carrier protein n=1 Tax=Austwickia chelonae NBRC 105200 TaxID=1184607 RepID=K6UN11_9MICO|nr:citrate lyase acyl carrier protein [Austwickia chelonae]GAB78596.1 citrate lyase acyl carrier protein [Austwickia chelonae NBRC 105200]SEW34012.1 citrate lyase subunit gamma (acyl carrier protein) [Austwickia chelonae]